MRWARLALDVVGAIGFAMGLWRVVQQTRCSTTYDEGILLSHTWVLLTQGGLPFRDFYTQYPPGIYVLLAAIWKVFGISVMADRILSEVLRVGIALLAGVTAGRLAPSGAPPRLIFRSPGPEPPRLIFETPRRHGWHELYPGMCTKDST